MFGKLEGFFRGTEAKPKDDSLGKIAPAVLYLEMASADFEVSSEEREKIRSTLRRFFGLGKEEVDGLMDAAGRERAARNDLWYFTNAIKQKYSREQKKIILENLWEIIFADGRVDKYEDALIRKVTGLLGLEHADMIAAKLKVQKQRQGM